MHKSEGKTWREEERKRRGEARREREMEKNFRCLSPQPECGSSEKEMGREWLPKTEYTYRFCCLFSEIKNVRGGKRTRRRRRRRGRGRANKTCAFPIAHFVNWGITPERTMRYETRKYSRIFYMAMIMCMQIACNLADRWRQQRVACNLLINSIKS